jgi:hypothetical protein
MHLHTPYVKCCDKQPSKRSCHHRIALCKPYRNHQMDYRKFVGVWPKTRVFRREWLCIYRRQYLCNYLGLRISLHACRYCTPKALSEKQMEKIRKMKDFKNYNSPVIDPNEYRNGLRCANGDVRWLVKSVSKFHPKRVYLVQWKGNLRTARTWEKFSQLKVSCSQVLSR